MNYEDILFGLQPILNAESVTDIPMNDIYLKSYITVLDQLAVSLRAPDNRKIVGQTGLLSNLLRVLNDFLDKIFSSDTFNVPWLSMTSELIRCIANALVDNDRNRDILISNKGANKIPLIEYYIGRILKLIELPEEQVLKELQMRSIVLVKNLIVDNEKYIKRFAPSITGPLIILLQNNQNVYLEDPDTVVLATELLWEVIELIPEGITISDITFFCQLIERISHTVVSLDTKMPDNLTIPVNKIEEVESSVLDEDDDEKSSLDGVEDPNVDLLFNLSQTVERLVSNEQLKIKDEQQFITKMQTSLFQSLETLSDKEFQSKLIIMRRLTSSIGHISANKSNHNKNEIPLCVKYINESTNGYTLAAAVIVLSNSIGSREEADMITEHVSIEEILNVSSNFGDPMQFQGVLDILRKLLSIKNAMFLTIETLQKLFTVLKISTDQAKYFNNLAPLVEKLVSKLVSVLPSSSLFTLINDKSSGMALDVILNQSSVVPCLVLDKLMVAKKQTDDDIYGKLWNLVFKFQDSSLTQNFSASNLYQLTKTIGIQLRNCNVKGEQGSLLLVKYADKLQAVMNSIKSLETNTDTGSKAILNNGKFIAGMIIKILEHETTLTCEETQLLEISKTFF